MLARGQVINRLEEQWDVIVVGGGITGAGVLREASRRGMRCLLLEQRDFAWGTSSRSGKMVHGGLRYLRQGQAKTTWHSVRERERLLREYAGLVEPLGFLVPLYAGKRWEPLLLKVGLSLYDLMALRRSHRRYNALDLSLLVPSLRRDGLLGGFWYRDARTDDARLVLWAIKEGVALGGAALNYARVEALLRDRRGRVCGVAVRDVVTGRTMEVEAQVVINAAGAWTDRVRSWTGAPPRLRRLRGSHLVFPRWRFPLFQAVGFSHPRDGRLVYAFPWEQVTLVGTTDVDHDQPLDREPRMSQSEGEYLLEGIGKAFPSLELTAEDVMSTFSGVRPVVGTGRRDPSREPRDHVVWAEDGMVTVAGGKLTTFSLLARDALNKASAWLRGGSGASGRPKGARVDTAPEQYLGLLDHGRMRRLLGRYGKDAAALVEEAGRGELEPVPGTEILWAELRWAARHEAVVHLDDLLLRRVRLGNLLPEGGAGLLDRVRPVVQPALGWDSDRWERETARYVKLWREAYSPDLMVK